MRKYELDTVWYSRIEFYIVLQQIQDQCSTEFFRLAPPVVLCWASPNARLTARSPFTLATPMTLADATRSVQRIWCMMNHDESWWIMMMIWFELIWCMPKAVVALSVDWLAGDHIRLLTSCTFPPVRSILSRSLARSGLWSCSFGISKTSEKMKKIKGNHGNSRKIRERTKVSYFESCVTMRRKFSVRFSGSQRSVVRPLSVPGPGKIEPSALPRRTRLSPILPTRRW